MVLKEIRLVPKNTFEKLNSNFSCQQIMIQSLHQTPLYHHVEGNAHVLTDWRLLLVM